MKPCPSLVCIQMSSERMLILRLVFLFHIKIFIFNIEKRNLQTEPVFVGYTEQFKKRAISSHIIQCNFFLSLYSSISKYLLGFKFQKATMSPLKNPSFRKSVTNVHRFLHCRRVFFQRQVYFSSFLKKFLAELCSCKLAPPPFTKIGNMSFFLLT